MYFILLLTKELPNSFSWADKVWMPILVTLLSSGFLVAVFEFIKWNKDKKITNITFERKHWRDDLRDIAANLAICKCNNQLNRELTKLKVRINTKGLINICPPEAYRDGAKYFERDCYLWFIIKEIEDSNSFYDKKRLVVFLNEAISLLVKHDWDRSKGEIHSPEFKKNIIHLYISMTLLIASITFVIDYLMSCYYLLVPYFLYLLFIPIFIQYTRHYISKETLESNKKNRISIERTKSLHMDCTITSFSIYILLLVIDYFIYVKHFTIIAETTGLNSMIISLSFVFIIVSSKIFYFCVGETFKTVRYNDTKSYYLISKDIIKRVKALKKGISTNSLFVNKK